MDKRDYKLAFDRLMRYWETEYVATDICNLSDDDLSFFMKFQKQLHQWKNDGVNENLEPSVKGIFTDVQSEAVNIVDFFVKDLLDLRQQKIIDSCRKLKIIDQHLLTSSEKGFYKTILSAFKGYSKIRNVYDVMTDSCDVEEDDHQEEDTFCRTEEVKITSHDVKYRTVCLTEDVPAIVGSDLLIYGPFLRGDIANIPRPNAIILEKENLAQSLD